MEQVAKANNSPRPADPGEVRLETVNPPAFRQVLASLPFDRASQPLVANDGIAVIIVCSREQKNLAQQSKQEVQAQLLNERVELLSRQLLANLRRHADDRSAPQRRVIAPPPLREVIARHGLAARRSLGQHFLLDANLTQRIVREAGPLAGRHVVEIGPGPGGLTRALLGSEAASVTVDRDRPARGRGDAGTRGGGGRAAARGRRRCA